MSVLTPLVDALARAAVMVWDTWWALVLGFALSGAIEAFVSETTVRDALGGDGPRELALAGLFGAASSSCSYSAVGTTKTLFGKGASAAASLGVFMFASTDLVIELGLVVWVLLGWQFVVGEYVGGVVAALVLALAFKYAVPTSWVEAGREHVRQFGDTACGTCDADVDPEDPETVTLEVAGGVEYFCCGGCRRVYEATEDGDASLRERLTTPEGWKSASRAAMKDWEMLWSDIAIGFGIAALAGALVPASWWAALFPAEVTLVGVLGATAVAVAIGALTFMCSVGNVPFALVLWRNGLPFGGVLAFIYADLLIPPLVNVYRRYYGPRLAAALTASLAAAAFLAGVLVHYLVGVTIAPPAGEVGGTVPDGYTTVLNLAFTPVFAAQAYLTYGLDGLRAGGRQLLARAARAVLFARDLLVAVVLPVIGSVYVAVGGLVVVVALLRSAGAGARQLVAASAVPRRRVRQAMALLAAAGADCRRAFRSAADRARERFRDSPATGSGPAAPLGLPRFDSFLDRLTGPGPAEASEPSPEADED